MLAYYFLCVTNVIRVVAGYFCHISLNWLFLLAKIRFRLSSSNNLLVFPFFLIYYLSDSCFVCAIKKKGTKIRKASGYFHPMPLKLLLINSCENSWYSLSFNIENAIRQTICYNSIGRQIKMMWEDFGIGYMYYRLCSIAIFMRITNHFLIVIRISITFQPMNIFLSFFFSFW